VPGAPARHTSNHLCAGVGSRRRPAEKAEDKSRRRRGGGSTAAHREQGCGAADGESGVRERQTQRSAARAEWRAGPARELGRQQGATKRAAAATTDLFDSAMPASEQSAWNEMSSSW